jgi:hypothetical protein
MKVKDLIEKLQAVDPELMVVRGGYEGGVTEVGSVDVEQVALNANEEWYYGEHETLYADEKANRKYAGKERALVVHIT